MTGFCGAFCSGGDAWAVGPAGDSDDLAERLFPAAAADRLFPAAAERPVEVLLVSRLSSSDMGASCLRSRDTYVAVSSIFASS
ncbi:TPA: hypothetical protein EYN23_20110, partial [Candidatus Poribacteria bacterium]|nr:hypothetical protein [Candidatus Poribacteria bacterium]